MVLYMYGVLMHKDAYAGAPSKLSSTAARTPASESPENTPEKPRYPFLSYFSILLSSRPKPPSQAEAPPKVKTSQCRSYQLKPSENF
ncbi:hypothetical protein AVEN_173257-1 [Araneus ventricosus]|uniref:Uncharacterized protein n=1 Tax=Araneus ventricosus TaxID=182803 RepID=A0A4Y2HFM3_ARAVE|nr:hypothetical protein AVEN_173257-1 [Araneus ventricosus]